MKRYYFLLLIFIFFEGCQSSFKEIILDKDSQAVKTVIVYNSKNKTSYHYCDYYDNCQKQAEGYCKEDKKVGKWTYWFEDGVEKYSADYYNGIKTYDHRYRDMPQILMEESLSKGNCTYFKVLNIYDGEFLSVSDNAELYASEDGSYTYKIIPLYGDSIYFYYEVLEAVSVNKEKYEEYARMLDLSVEDIANTRFYKTETIVLTSFEIQQ